MPYPQILNKADEIRRLQTLLSYNILDTAPEKDFDGLVELIALICDTPIATISMIDHQRQWHKARVGITADETSLEDTFCKYTVIQNEILEIPDARIDERVKNNPHVLEENGIRFYAGLPLKAGNGDNIGTICVVDHQPKHLSKEQKNALQLLATQTMMLLEARKMNIKLSGELENILNQRIRETERQLDQKKIEYKKLLKAIKKSNGVVEFSPEGIIKSANQNFLDMVGYEKHELLGHHHAVLLDEDMLQENRDLWVSLAGGKYKPGKVKRRHKDGSIKWLQATYNPLLDGDDKVVKVIKVAQDITAEIATEVALKNAKDLAEQLNHQKDNFIANVSHEIRTPIHAILGFTDLLLEQEDEPLKLNYLKSVKTAGDNLLFIINDILDLSKIEAGIIQLEKETFHLEEVLKNVFSILHLKAHQKKLIFRYFLPKEVPQKFIGDKNRLSQILINLLGNALKFTTKGSIELYVRHQQTEEGKTLLGFDITDTGIGISKDKLEKIFERFSQAEENTARQFGGTGLGLNISRQLIEKQEGSIEVESVPGTGSKFSFKIPYQIAEQVKIEVPVINYSVYNEQQSARILLCEDNELNQRLIRAILNARGHETDLAENGEKGFELFEENQYDLILMDIQMPERNGFQTTEDIRKTGSKVPIIALTANFLLTEREKCLSMGMNDYLSKPFTREEILSKIDLWLNYNKDLATIPTVEEFPYKKSPVSLTTLEEFSGGNKEFEEEMINLFISQSQLIYLEIENFLTEGDYASVKFKAHKLKASFGIVGAETRWLDALENVSENTSLSEDIEQILASLDLQIREVINALEPRIKNPA